MRGDFDEDEDPDFEPEWCSLDAEDDMCVDCQRFGSHWDVCGCCGATMCAGCFEMGCGVYQPVLPDLEGRTEVGCVG